MLSAVLTLALPAFAAGAALAWAARRLPSSPEPLAERIDALLPQTQCAQCGYPGCRPYARAIAEGSVDINRCPPGGEATLQALAKLLDRSPLPLDPDCATVPTLRVARIRERDCIGCARCLPACPVDAIVGAPQHMHTVLAAECTGCELCLDPCPVDCIDMHPAPAAASDA